MLIDNDITVKFGGKEYECKITNEFAKYLDRKVGIHQAGFDIESKPAIPPLSLIAEILALTLNWNSHKVPEDEVYQLLCDYMRSGKGSETEKVAAVVGAVRSILYLCVPPPMDLPERKDPEKVDVKK